MGGEHHVGALGNLGGFVDEDHAAVLEGLHHVLVVHDFLADVDRCAVLFERLLHSLHGAVNTSAVASRCCQQNPLVSVGWLASIGGFGGVSNGHVSHRITRSKPQAVTLVAAGSPGRCLGCPYNE